MSNMTNKPTYDNLYHHDMTEAIRAYNYGDITVEEFIDKVYEVGAKCVLPDIFYTLINHRHDFRNECHQAMNTLSTIEMIKAYEAMMVVVSRVLASEGTNL